MKNRYLIIIAILFVAMSGVLYGFTLWQPGYDYWVLMGGNLVMALLVIASYFMVKRQLSKRPTAFVQGVSGSSLLKLFVCMVGILAYVLLNKEHLHKPTVFALLGIYVVYSITETTLLSKIVRVK